VFGWVEALVEELYVSVEAGHLTPQSRVGLVGCSAGQGGPLGLEPGPAEHGSQPPRTLLVGFYLEGMAPVSFRCAGVDGPGLSLLPAPVPGEVFDGLVRVVGDGVNVGGVSGSAHGDVSELSPAAVGEEMGGIEGGALASMDGRGVSQGELVRADLIGA
jgi:hypothetical protein